MALNENSREAVKKQAENKEAMQESQNREQKPAKKKDKIRVRMIPIWLRLIIVTVLIFLSIVVGAMVGGLIMAVMSNGMQLLGVETAWQQVVKGMVLLLAVAFDVFNKRRAEAVR